VRSYLDPEDIANEIRMTRSHHKGSFLIVEGKVADLRVYQRFIDPEACQIIPAHGKDNAVNTLRILEYDNFDGVLAVVDSDFWRLESKEPTSVNLFVTDTHDIETMILKASVVHRLLDEFGSYAKIQNLTEKRGKSVYEMLLESGRPIGYLRWVSQQQGLALAFENLNFRRFVDDDTLAVDTDRLVQEVKNKSGRHDLQNEGLRTAIAEATDDRHDPWDVCCGHDLVQIMSVGLRKSLGSNDANDVKPDLLEKILRIAYEFPHFSDTQLYVSLKAWEAANSSFRLFAT
jgi:hypothetical protein